MSRKHQQLYHQQELIGEGTYGSVYGARCLETKQPVALKKIKQKPTEGFPVSAIREIKILQALNHPNVLKLLNVVSMQGSVYMVLEFCDHDLAGLMESDIKLTEPQIKYYIHSILQALCYCHDHGVLHRDIKAANVLISNNGDVKLADYGLARLEDLEDGTYTNRVVTLWYRAPELLLGMDVYSAKIDTWSVGCLLAEMLTGTVLFPGKSTDCDQLGLIYNICGTPDETKWAALAQSEIYLAFRPRVPSKSSLAETLKTQGVRPLAIDLLERLLTVTPSARCSAREALDHPYFQEKEVPMWTRSDHPHYPGHLLQYETKRKRKAREAGQRRRKRKDRGERGERGDSRDSGPRRKHSRSSSRPRVAMGRRAST